MTPRTPQENEKIRSERQAEILDEALELFAEQGFHDTKIAQIASRLNIAKGTIYWYFDSKEELFRTAFRHKFEELVDPLIAVVVDPARTPPEKLISVAEASLAILSNDRRLMLILFQAMSTPGIAELLAHDFIDYYEQFGVLIASLFEQIGDPDPRASATLYIAALDGLMLQYLAAPGLFDQQRVFSQLGRKFGY